MPHCFQRLLTWFQADRGTSKTSIMYQFPREPVLCVMNDIAMVNSLITLLTWHWNLSFSCLPLHIVDYVKWASFLHILCKTGGVIDHQRGTWNFVRHLCKESAYHACCPLENMTKWVKGYHCRWCLFFSSMCLWLSFRVDSGEKQPSTSSKPTSVPIVSEGRR